MGKKCCKKIIQSVHFEIQRANCFAVGSFKCLFCECDTIRSQFLKLQETYGEDPHLTSQIVSAHIRGVQGSHPRYKRALDVCKHFDAHGGPENIPQSRFSFDANVRICWLYKRENLLVVPCFDRQTK